MAPKRLEEGLFIVEDFDIVYVGDARTLPKKVEDFDAQWYAQPYTGCFRQPIVVFNGVPKRIDPSDKARIQENSQLFGPILVGLPKNIKPGAKLLINIDND